MFAVWEGNISQTDRVDDISQLLVMEKWYSIPIYGWFSIWREGNIYRDRAYDGVRYREQ